MDDLKALFQEMTTSVPAVDVDIRRELAAMTVEQFSEKIRAMCASIPVLVGGDGEPEVLDAPSIDYAFNESAFESTYTPYHVEAVEIGGIGDAYSLKADYKVRMAAKKVMSPDIYDENGGLKTIKFDKSNCILDSKGESVKMSEEDTTETMISNQILLYAELHKDEDVPVKKLISIIAEEKQKKAEALHKEIINKHSGISYQDILNKHSGISYQDILNETDADTFRMRRGL